MAPYMFAGVQILHPRLFAGAPGRAVLAQPAVRPVPWRRGRSVRCRSPRRLVPRRDPGGPGRRRAPRSPAPAVRGMTPAPPGAAEGAPNVYTIRPGLPFVDALAAGIYETIGDEPAVLASVTVLLPTRRACRSLTEAFLRRSGGPAAAAAAHAAARRHRRGRACCSAAPTTPALAADAELPLAISPLRRQLLLMRLIHALPHATMRVPADQAARLAAELARLLDQVQTERLDFRRLPDAGAGRASPSTGRSPSVSSPSSPRRGRGCWRKRGASARPSAATCCMAAQARGVDGSAAGGPGDRRRLHRQHARHRRPAGGGGPACRGARGPARASTARRRRDWNALASPRHPQYGLARLLDAPGPRPPRGPSTGPPPASAGNDRRSGPR